MVFWNLLDHFSSLQSSHRPCLLVSFDKTRGRCPARVAEELEIFVRSQRRDAELCRLADRQFFRARHSVTWTCGQSSKHSEGSRRNGPWPCQAVSFLFLRFVGRPVGIDA